MGPPVWQRALAPLQQAVAQCAAMHALYGNINDSVASGQLVLSLADGALDNLCSNSVQLASFNAFVVLLVFHMW